MDFLPKCTLGALSLTILVIFTRSFAHGANELTTNADYNNYKVLRYGEELKLVCNVTNPSTDLVIKWLKNGKPIRTSDGDRPHVLIRDNSLTVNYGMEADVANYTCQLVNSKNTNATIAFFEFEVVGRPYVKLPETVTVTENEKLKLECIVIGSPPPTVEWTVGNETYDTSRGRVKLSTDPEKNIKNNIMELEGVTLDDRGEVACSAANIAVTMGSDKNNPMKATIYVRIKDKYAAVWPFLGICAEVIVLCTVIFIYEKKRNKAELEESDTDQSPEQKNTPDHGKDSVRQRK